MLIRSFVTQSLTKLTGGGKMKKQKSDKLDKRRSNDKINPISYNDTNINTTNNSLSLTYFGGL